MDKLLGIDWEAVFVPSSSILEIMVRGTLTYWIIFLYMRFFRRSSGQLSITDILLITLISDASQNAMAGSYESVTEGAVLVGTLAGWDYLINWLGFRSALFNKLGNPDPILLVKDGDIQYQNLKRELITEEELISLLRQQGIDDLAQVKQCNLEGSGSLSVIQK